MSSILKIKNKNLFANISYLFLFFLLNSISFSNVYETSAIGFENFISWIVSFHQMTKYILMLGGAALFIWSIIQIFQQAEFTQIILKLVGGLLLFAIGFNIDKMAKAVGGSVIDLTYLKNCIEYPMIFLGV